MIYRNSFLALLVLVYPIVLEAQLGNLVLNPSFEEHSPCSAKTGELIDSVYHWSVVAGQAKWLDLGCPLSSEQTVYVQAMKLPPAFRGSSYVGLGLDVEGEFIQGGLIKKLEAGRVYRVSMRVRIPIPFCTWGVKQLGLAFGREPWASLSPNYASLGAERLCVLKNAEQTRFQQNYDWEYIEGFYTAEGGEAFFCIGSFKGLNDKDFAQRKKGDCSYVYLDDVLIEPWLNEAPKFWTLGRSEAGLYRLKLNWEAETEELDWEASFEELKNLAQFLQSLQENWGEIKIKVHTYTEVAEGANLAKGERLLEDLQKVLLQQGGLGPNKISWEAMGSQYPLGKRTAIEDKDLNRRFELELKPLDKNLKKGS